MFCDYNCGLPSTHTLKNGKNCCSDSFYGCKGYKEKISKGCKKSYQSNKRLSGKDNYNSFTTELKKSMAWSKNKILKPISDIFIKNSNSSNSLIKKVLIKNNLIKNECNNCNITDWNGKPLSLELDHINGDSRDNTLENLRFLCPNCHSQTDTFRGKNINNGLVKVSDDELILAINSSKNTREALIKVKLAPKGGNYNRVKKIIDSGLANFSK